MCDCLALLVVEVDARDVEIVYEAWMGVIDYRCMYHGN